MKKNPFVLLQAATDSWRLWWRLLLQRQGLLKVLFQPQYPCDRRSAILLLFRRYGQQWPDLNPDECEWKLIRDNTWVLELPRRLGHLGSVRNDRDLPHVRLKQSQGDEAKDFRQSPDTVTKKGTYPPPNPDSLLPPMTTAAEAAHPIRKESGLTDPENGKTLSASRGDRKSCPHCHTTVPNPRPGYCCPVCQMPFPSC